MLIFVYLTVIGGGFIRYKLVRKSWSTGFVDRNVGLPCTDAENK